MEQIASDSNEKEEIEKGKEMDIYELFNHYNSLYFDDALGSCLLYWNSSRQMKSWTGACHYDSGGGCQILLSEPLLQSCSTADIKNALLHEMIHAFLWIKHKNKNHSDHGSNFQEVRNSINSISVIDVQKPSGGYNITLHHEFRKSVTTPELGNEIKTYRFQQWICDTCGDLVKKSREPSARDCIDKVGPDTSCSNLSCHWHNHRSACPGSYTISESPKCREKQTSLKAEQDIEHDVSNEPPRIDGQTTKKLSKPEATTRKDGARMDSEDGNQELHENNLLPSLTSQAVSQLCLTEELKGKSDGKKAIRIADYFQPAEDTQRNLVINTSSSDDSCEELLHDWLEASNARSRSFARKASKPAVMRHTSKKRKGCGTSKNSYWLCMYGDEEEDETVEPLINKRTERRKRLKLLLTGRRDATEIEDAKDEKETLINKRTERRRLKLLKTAEK